MTTPQLSVRQMGPAFARGLARHTRQEIEAPARHLFDDALRAMRNRFGIRLRGAEVKRIAARLLDAARKLAIGPIVRVDGFAFNATLPYVQDGVVRIGRFSFAPRLSRVGGGYWLVVHVTDLVHLSRHALERMHLRMSSTSWRDLAPATLSLARLDTIAQAARCASLRWMWLPTGAGDAFVLTFDESVPVAVSYLDALSHPRTNLIEPIKRWLDDPNADGDVLVEILRRSEFDLWRRERAAS